MFDLRIVADFKALSFQFDTKLYTKILTLNLALNRYYFYTLLAVGFIWFRW